MKAYFLMAAAFALAGLMGSANTAHATCSPGKAGYDLTGDEAQAVYECLAEDMKAGYESGPKRWIPAAYVEEYRDWVRASSFPAAPGFHGERFLVTWVNETGADAYMQYEEDPDIPAGTLIAKESFAVSENGTVQSGPLFFMEKVAEGVSPSTDDWYYMAVAPNGAPMAVDVQSACSQCHQGAYGHQGGLGYPVEEARIPR